MGVNLDLNELNKIESLFTSKKIAVIGDMMLDVYYWGEVNKVSPEAPVPVVEVDDDFVRFGGAANVALNILTLGGKPLAIGVVGNDHDGKTFLELMQNKNLDSQGIITDSTRSTTNKTRVIADKQHIVRIDKESKHFISSEIEKKILDMLTDKINDIDSIILQDYNKGVLTKNIIEESIKLAKEHNKVITVDPKFINFLKYKDVTVFKPNKKETENILGMRIISEEDISTAGKKLLELLNAKFVLLTLGEEGVALFNNDDKEIRIPTKARKITDVSGAGDTVISTITYALSAGATIEQAAYIANFAGGLVCQEVGIVPIKKEKLFNSIRAELK
ncbi:MAG: D-glycero-beta-D-manno-heptose-7-phosphate kinase [Ignavibacteriae bacterium]|nr:MAG: D-glycero-beta-D-manno-heptose-7-phosphate kinase [Ignavibacteriota bacterium]